MTLILSMPSTFEDEDTVTDFYLDNGNSMCGRYRLRAWGNKFGYSYWKIENDCIYFKHEGSTSWNLIRDDGGNTKGSVYKAKPLLMEILSEFDKTFFGE